MAYIVPDDVERYAEEHTSAPAAHLARLAEETRAQLSSPQMLTGAIEGRFLEFLVFATGARRVLEFGTYSGYSALSMVAALPPDGQVITLEIDEERAAFARRHIDAAGESGRIDVRVGPALESVAELQGPFDLVFIDADKEGYRDYCEASLPLLAERGLIAVDNVLWSGRVADPSNDEDTTQAVRAFNDHVHADERVVNVMLSVRDGVTLIRRA
ncbi:MAG: class I SAM-dependent methyltransferase [Thermoleophilaceae bacterium]